jgi:hypothetical protein
LAFCFEASSEENGYNGDNISALVEKLSNSFGVAVNSMDEVSFTDEQNNRIRKLH